MRVVITCPNCNTSYQIDDSKIKKSDGHARCYQCNHIFNALLNAQPVADANNVDHLNLPDSADLYDQESTVIKSELMDELADRELSSLFVPEQQSALITGPDDITLQDSGNLKPEDLLDIHSDKLAEIEPLTANQSKPVTTSRPTLIGTFFWSITILLLLAAFLVQVAWINRDQVLANNQARQLIEKACNHIPRCELPVKHAPESYEIIERQVSLHPKVKGILSLSLMFENRADFAQQAPGITLSLFDSKQTLIARRSFSYKDYLAKPPRQTPTFEPGHVQKVFLNLEDPGPDVTGFEFNFY